VPRALLQSCINNVFSLSMRDGALPVLPTLPRVPEDEIDQEKQKDTLGTLPLSRIYDDDYCKVSRLKTRLRKLSHRPKAQSPKSSLDLPPKRAVVLRGAWSVPRTPNPEPRNLSKHVPC